MEHQTSWTIGSLSAIAAAAGLPAPKPSAPAQKAIVAAGWLARGEASYSLFKTVVERAGDLSWLKKGDSILVKPAMNSGKPHPAVTDPWALESLLRLLAERGAGKIYVGDQSGVRNVYWTAAGRQRGASRAFAADTGLLPVIEAHGAIPVFFEERGYDAYFPACPAGAHHWPEPPQITTLVRDVDHIVYLPRLGSHIMADITAGLKVGVGFLREDSRRLLHQGGAHFAAMYAELNEIPEIKAKLRLTVTAARKIMTLFGPDDGHVVEPAAGAVFASEDLLAHDLFAYACLQHARDRLTPPDASLPDFGNLWEFMATRTARNRGFCKLVWDLGDDCVPEMPAFRPAGLHSHAAFASYLAHNAAADREYHVAEINPCPDPDLVPSLQRLLRV
jgi:uncharacterized protein (DUF362 family)